MSEEVVIDVINNNSSPLDDGSFSNTIDRISRCVIQHRDWRSVKYKSKRYQLFGGVHVNHFINLDNPINPNRKPRTIFRMHDCVTIETSLEHAVVVRPPTKTNSMVKVRIMSTSRIVDVSQNMLLRLRKYVRGSLIGVYYCGKYTDEDGRVWMYYASERNTLSAWVRLESPGRRAQITYDAGNHWRNTLDDRIN